MAADILFTVAEKLAQFHRVPNLSTAYRGIKWMETELMRVHELLKEDPGLEKNHKELRKWVRDLIHAAQNIEDIVDNFNFNVEKRRQGKGCMRSALLAVKDKMARYKIVAEVMHAKEKMGRICESMPNKQVLGFAEDFDALVKLLVEGNDPHPLYMFIVGPCGAGKTTLVKEVYDSYAVKKQFPSRFWLCGQEYKLPSPDFFIKMSKKVGRSAESIADAIKGKRYLIVVDINLECPGDITLREDLMLDIRKAFPDERNGSRVVITFNDKRGADLFGQKMEVHELGMLSSGQKWKLFLNTWDFDAATAETTAGTSLSSGMLEEIVRKQMHLPSEIVNLGALLSMNYRKSSALSNIMHDHPYYFQVDGPERTLSKIASSFNLLESPLKLFLLYCSLFPKGFEIPKRRVIGLWLAEGWLQTEDERFHPAEERLRLAEGCLQTEDERFHPAEERLRLAEGWLQTEDERFHPAEEGLWLPEGWLQTEDERFHPAEERLLTRVKSYFGELSHLGMIQVEYSYLQRRYGREDFYFGVKRIRLESPVWDFAAMKAKQYNLSHNIDNEGPPDSRSSSSNARGLALHSSGIYNHIFHDQKVSLPNLRRLLCFPQLTVIGGEVTFPTSRFKLLRVLDLEDMYFITQVSEEIGELVHLKCLGLRRTGLYSLPNSIGNLRNLESLDIRGTRVKPIPTAIQKLKRLQYLFMDRDDGSTDDKDSLDLSSLERLRVLSVIRIGRWMENGLGGLHNLTKLGIYGDVHDYEYPRQVTELNCLRSFRLGFGFGDIIPEYILPFTNWSMPSLCLERPLRTLPDPDKFPSLLKKLCLKWSLLEQDPMATLERLDYLSVLKLRCGSFLGKKMVCSANRFQDLIFLELSLLDGLEEWTVEVGAMRKLKHLVIRLCNRLKELPQELLHLQFMEKLEVAGMPYTFNARLQYNKGEDWHKIKRIKSVTVDGIQMAASSSSSSSSLQPY